MQNIIVELCRVENKIVSGGDEDMNRNPDMILVSTHELKRLYAKIREYERIYDLVGFEEIQRIKQLLVEHQDY